MIESRRMIMEQKNSVELTSAEMANLWTSYQNDSLAICVIKYFLEHVQDNDIRRVLEYALHLSQQHIETVTDILECQDFPIPQGFTDEDVNIKVPRLYSDNFLLFYMNNMAKFGSNAYTVALSNTARSDIREFYTECGYSSSELFNKSTTVLQNKGLFLRAPAIPKPEKVEFVQKQNFLTG